MKPFEDKDCICNILEDAIEKKCPDCEWNMGDCCTLWNKLSNQIIDNDIEFDDGSDYNYGCTCPRCGRMICGWCV